MEKRLEAYEMLVLKRNEIELSDYNPRKISESARKKLKKNIKTHGFVQPVIVNRRTMRVVGGHQRLAIADEIMKTDDYEVNCAVIDVGEKEEVSINVFLNNPSAQGEWDIGALQDITKLFPDIDFETDLGFDLSDIEVMRLEREQDEAYNLVGNTVTEAKREARQEAIRQERGQGKASEEEISEEAAEARKAEANEFRDIKKHARETAKAENADGMGAVDTVDYTLTIVFPNNHEKHDFMRKIRKDPKEKYVKSTVLLDIYNHVYDISVFGGQK